MFTFDRPGMTLLASGDETGAAFELIEDRREPGEGAPRHRHRALDEAFYVLDGAFTFFRGEEETVREHGQSIVIPRGTIHGYRAEEKGSRQLLIVVPAGLAEFLNEMGRLMAAGASPLEAMSALSDRYDNEPIG